MHEKAKAYVLESLKMPRGPGKSLTPLESNAIMQEGSFEIVWNEFRALGTMQL